MARDFSILRECRSPAAAPRAIAAIPARNEAMDVVSCLAAIGSQKFQEGSGLERSVGVVLLVNNTNDDTFDAAKAFVGSLSCAYRIYDVTMSQSTSHAGGARRAAMDLAAAWLVESDRQDGIIFTTDADSTPAQDWMATAYAAFDRGVDAVAGSICLHDADEAALPAHVKARGKLEARYEGLLTELFSLLDPRPHDAWPRHATEAGANLAVTLKAYRAIGGIPVVACGEDRALVARLESSGFLIRHDPSVRVSTSGRLKGRAAGGVADTLRLRCENVDSVCDDYLEPAWNARFRAFWRGRLREIFARDGKDEALQAFGCRGLCLEAGDSFDDFWKALEDRHQRLRRRLIRPSQLPEEILAATVMVKRYRRLVKPTVRIDPDDSPLFVPAE